MAAPVYVANILRARFIWSDGAGTFGHHIDFTYVATGGPPSETDLLAFATDLSTELTSQFGHAIPASYLLTGVTVTPQDNGTFPSAEWTGSIAGTASGSGPGSGVSQDLIWVVPLRYRGGRPRSSFPPGPVSNMTGDRRWSTAAITGFESAIAAFMTHYTARAFGEITIGSVACISYTHLGVPREPPLVLLPSTGILRARLGSMRKRTR